MVKEYDNLKLEILISPPKKTKKFRSFATYKKHILEEMELWKNCLNGKLSDTRLLYLDSWNLLQKLEATEYEPDIMKLTNQLNKLAMSPFAISSKTDLGKILLECYEDSSNVADGFWLYYFNKSVNISNHQVLKGVLQAHLFKYSFESLNSTTSKIYEEMQNIISEYQRDFHEIEGEISKANRDFQAMKETLDFNFKQWYQEQISQTNDWFTEKENKLKDLEAIYQEKLRLKAPAEYWKKYKDEYQKAGRRWTWISIGLVAVITSLSFFLLRKMPDQLFTGNRIELENVIRWTILLALIYSSIFYFLRISVKLVLSSYHLSRDANERLQLTHQYLALLSENAIDDKHREIILKSLFSRSDSGLLKGDSTPAIPDSMLSTIAKNLAK